MGRRKGVPLPESGLGAGFRFSTYGPRYDPGPEYWVSAGERMAAGFPGSHVEGIWIVSNFQKSGGTLLSFPASTEDPYITFTSEDGNEAALSHFDRKGFKIWLQVEPGYARMPGLIELVLERYKSHPCVTGFGVDVEWFRSDGTAQGTPVSDPEAENWLKAVRKVNPEYRMFLKHWLPGYLPPIVRDGIVFIDDSQQFRSLRQLKVEFAEWGRHFSPAPVGFQFGYPADKHWWGRLDDPPVEIGRTILESTPNTSALFWVDFTILDVFPVT